MTGTCSSAYFAPEARAGIGRASCGPTFGDNCPSTWFPRHSSHWTGCRRPPTASSTWRRCRTSRSRRDEDVEYVPPRGSVEEALADIWRSTLEVEQIGAGDNFFALGGHSLLAAQVRSRIHQRLGIELPLDALFDDQTLADLARRIEETAPGARRHRRCGPCRVRESCPHPMRRKRCGLAERDDPGSRAHWIDVSIRIAGPLDAAEVVRAVSERRCEPRSVAHNVPGLRDVSLSQVILDSYVPDVPILEVVRRRRQHAPIKLMARSRHPPAISGRLDAARRGPARSPPARPSHARRWVLDAAAAQRDRWTRCAFAGVRRRTASTDHGLEYADYAVWERAWLTGAALDETRRLLLSSVRTCRRAAPAAHRPPAYRSPGPKRTPVRVRVPF